MNKREKKLLIFKRLSCQALTKRKEEEERLRQLQVKTLAKYRDDILAVASDFGKQLSL